jgi:hypothetical protein
LAGEKNSYLCTPLHEKVESSLEKRSRKKEKEKKVQEI